jgi:hypothetical protein
MHELDPVGSVGDLISHLNGKLRRLRPLYVKDLSIATSLPFPFGLWFRGQPDASKELTPRVFRSDRSTQDETSMYNHFLVRSPEHRLLHKGVFDWLCLMQHYDLPTRLLDWSESALIGLFFAVSKQPSKDGRVFVISAQRLNSITNWQLAPGRAPETISSPWSLGTVMRSHMAVSRSLDEWRQRMRSMTDMDSGRAAVCREIGGNVLDSQLLSTLRQPLAVLPSRLNGRMIAQSSCFTLHGGKLYPDTSPVTDPLPEPITLEKLDDAQAPGSQFLFSFRVPGTSKRKIQKELWLLGIHAGSLFPEIDRQAQFIESLWTHGLQPRRTKKTPP